MVDSPSASMRDIRLHRPQPSTFRLDSSISGLLAGHRHGLHRTIIFPQDPRRSAVHQSDCSRYSRLVSHLQCPPGFTDNKPRSRGSRLVHRQGAQ
jgi:hypothetical protein